ncbi:MAG: ABC transporter ATP-binding protein [Planctomycetota bacterium]|nr:MAG: ABC transporter ATP-binding protein [Planctomycetota bacterium]
MLEVEGLYYKYDDGTQALCGVDLKIDRGETIALVGPNGSGKSTLLMCLSGLYFGQGTVRIDGMEMTKSGMKEIRGRVGLVFQSPDDQLFMPTLADDLAFGPINLGYDRAKVQERIDDAASQMQLSDMLDRAPYHLSMGQKRNASIATVLAMQPSLLMMDEPSSNLDPRSRRRLIEVLESLDTTMLIASHDLALIGRLCKRTALIDEGQIVADGPTADILGNRTLMEEHGLEVWPETAG